MLKTHKIFNFGKVIITTGRPDQYSDEKLSEHIKMIKRYNTVSSDGLKARIYNSIIISCIYFNDIIISGGAIKKPTSEYIEKIFKKADIEDGIYQKYQYEFGWLFTDEKYRGNGLSKIIRDQIFSDFNRPVFSTNESNNTPVIKTRERYNFTKIGNDFASNICHNLKIQLWVKN